MTAARARASTNGGSPAGTPERYCAFCGASISSERPAIERFGEPFCSEDHVGVLAVPRFALTGPVTIDKIGDRVQTLPKGQLPEFAGPGTPGIRTLYQYAVQHGDELQYIPCFCGCVNFGHKSNRDCYLTSINREGTLTFTSHAAT